MRDIQHPDQPDPLKRQHPEQYQPEAAPRRDGGAVINATAEYRDLRKLAEAAGVDPEQLARLKEI